MANARRPSRWLTYLLAVLCLAAIAAAVVVVGPAGSQGATTTERDVQAKRGVVQSTVSGSGNLEPAKQLELDFGADGTVAKVYVKPGDEVGRGDLLARLDDSDAKVALSEARAQLAEAEADLEAARQGATQTSTASSAATASTAATGDGPKSDGATMVALRAPVGATSASRSATETTPVEPAPTATGTTPQATTPQATTPQTTTAPAPSATGTTGTTPQSGSAGGSAGGSGASGGGSSSAGAASQTQAQRDAAIASAEAAVQKAKLAVAAAEEDLEDTRLRAPTRGTVAAVSGAAGDSVTAGSGGSGSGQAAGASADPSSGTTSGSATAGFVTLVKLRRMQMTVSFTEADITKVKVGQAATVSLSALEDVHLAGRVTSVAVLGDTSGDVVSYPVTILLAQDARDARAGMSATAEVVVARASGVTVPSQAVTGRGGTGVVLVRQDGETKSQRVTIGLQGDTSTQILAGLQAGDTVVIRSTPVTASSGGAASSRAGQGGQLGGAGGLGGGGFPGGGFPSGGRFPAGGSPGG